MDIRIERRINDALAAVCRFHFIKQEIKSGLPVLENTLKYPYSIRIARDVWNSKTDIELTFLATLITQLVVVYFLQVTGH